MTRPSAGSAPSSRAGIERKGGSLAIKQLRILPPFAIGRLGSASEPMDNYTFDPDINPSDPLGYRELKAQPTLIVDEHSGEIKEQGIRRRVEFEHGGRIRPVGPFLEVYAITDTDETLQ